MNRLVFSLAVLHLLLSAAAPSIAADRAWVVSIPHALSSDNLYKVRIVRIDGEPQKELIRYALPAGRHTVTVGMLLNVEWEPAFAEAPPGPGKKDLVIEIEAGKTYVLAARVHMEAPIEAQLDRSYWEPIVYRVD